MRIEAVVFDKDGTLFDFQATWAAPLLAFLDRVAPGDLRAVASEVLGVDPRTGQFRADSPVIASTTGEVAAMLAPVVGQTEQAIAAAFNEIGAQARQMPVVDLRPCLGALGLRFRLGLVTNDSEAPARAHLQQENVLDLFEFVAGYDSGYGAKPGPGQLLAFADATGISPEATLMVGDSRHDLVAGRAAGMIPVAVLTGIAKADDLSDLAEVILPHIGHLSAWIDAG